MSWPFVSTILVTYNEEAHIKESLNSLLYQTYPSDSREIIIVDGGSTDHTLEIVNECIDEYDRFLNKDNNEKIERAILHNTKKILAAGWNLGIRHASGEYVVRIDAHAYVAEDFIEKSVKTFQSLKDDENVVCVGGAMETISCTDTGELIKEALSSPFGVGGSKFRYKKDPGYVDTVAYGLYKKELFEKIGYFDEILVRTQDNDLHRRAREAGGKFYLNPEIRSFYYSRNTIKKLIKQQFQNGKWTMINFRRRPGKMALRHFIPFALVSALVFMLILGAFYRWYLFGIAFIIVLHLLCGTIFALKKKIKAIHTIKLPFIFILIHVVYGTGSFSGLFYNIKKMRQ